MKIHRSHPTRRTNTLLAAAIALAASLALMASPASAEVTYCTSVGSGAGQCAGQQGIAANGETGDLYVADRLNNRVSVFNADGSFDFAFGWDVIPGGATGLEKCTTASGCKAGSAGAGAGQFSSPSQIAIDNTDGPEQGKVYVGTDNFRVQKFDSDGTYLAAIGSGSDENSDPCKISGSGSPIAIGPGGDLFIADSAGHEPNFTSRVQKFSSAGSCLGETVVLTGSGRLNSLAVDAAEDAWVAADAELYKYDLATAETKLCSPAPGTGTGALAIDDEGHLFASQKEERSNPIAPRFDVVTEYDSASCAPLQRFGYGKIGVDEGGGTLVGLAPYQSIEGDLYAGERPSAFEPKEIVRYLAIPPLGPIVVPVSVNADPVKNTSATINAEVNPEGKETTVVIEYLDDARFDSEGGFDSPETKTSEAQVLAPGFNVKTVAIPVGCPAPTKELIEEGKCLAPEAEYHFRVRATNTDNPSGTGEATVVGAGFETKASTDFLELWASDVASDAAVLSAVVDPLGVPASGHFEVVDDATYLEDKISGDGFQRAIKFPDPDPPAEEAEIDFGSGDGGVERSTTVFPLEPGTTYHYRLAATNPLVAGFKTSEEKVFTTFAEPVKTPCSNDAFRFGPAGLLPDCRAFEMVSPLDKENGDIVVLLDSFSQLPATLDQAAVSGSRLTYGAYRAFGDAQAAPFTSQYLAERTAGGWENHGISPPRDGLIEESVNQLFDSEFRAFSADLCQGWIVPLSEPTLAPGANLGYRNLYRRDDRLCGGGDTYETVSNAAPENTLAGAVFKLELQGLSADGSVAAFVAKDSLLGSGAPNNPGGSMQLYLRAPGTTPVFACILPDGSPVTGDCSAGSGLGNFGFARNRHASVLNALSADGKRLYWSDDDGDGAIYLRENPLAEGGECVSPASPCTIPVSEEGESLAGTSNSHFWGAASDGSVAFFTTGGNLETIGDKLYSFTVQGEATKEIAGGVLGVMGASDDGSKVYFVSKQALAPGAQAGEPNLYLHDSSGGGSYRLVGVLAPDDVDGTVSSLVAKIPTSRNGRVSPSGLHAAFMSRASLTDYDNTDAASGEVDAEVFLYDAAADGGAGELVCASCNPSGGRPSGADVSQTNEPFWVAARLPTYVTTLHAPRVLAEDGSRLFFESQDALVPRDANNRIDVYQWEQVGTGGCTSGRSTYSPAAKGCVDLISSGDSPRNSKFVDASPTGEDVFFATLSSLFPSDYGLVDIYDARAGGGFPAPEGPAPSCEGEACQGAYVPPVDPSPASLGFRGAGNVREAAPGTKKCPKGKVKKKGKCVKKKRKGSKTKQSSKHKTRRAAR